MLYLLALIGVVSAKNIEENSVDWWNVLNAEVSCCPGHTSAGDCSNEGGSSCVFLPDPNNPIAQAAGSQCVGTSYEKCKSADINACCAPGCNGGATNPNNPPVGGPAPGNSPVCGPKTPEPTSNPTTATPTTAPTTACQLGVNYNFEGQSCTLSGDPHTTMFNGNKHDFQGQPLTQSGNGPEKLNQFYYISPCFGISDEEMPLKVLVTHYHWGTRSVSGADYLTVILTENEGGNTKQYYLYLSSALNYYVDASAGAISTDYDIANANGVAMNSLIPGQTASIGRRFQALYTNISPNYKSYFKITIDEKYQFSVYMQAQHYSQHSGRYAMHYIQMNVPSALKCYTCGICGDFSRISTGAPKEHIEGSSGGLIEYGAGWNPASTPEAFDCAGWSWEKHFADSNRDDQSYDPTDLECGLNEPVDPCPAGSQVATMTANKCEAAINAKSSCCNSIGNNFCEGLLSDCKVDVCAAANGDVNYDFDGAIQGIIVDPIEAVCADPELNPVPPTENRLCDLTGQSIKASRDNKVCTIDIKDVMVIEMEIEIGKIGDQQTTTWESVFHVGNENMQRWPGLWVHPTATTEGSANDGFHISYGTTTNNNPYHATSAAGGAYSEGDTVIYKSIQTQSQLTIIQNGVTIFDSAWNPHPIETNVNVYIGDPWYPAADVTIKNLVIKSLEANNAAQNELLFHRSYDNGKGETDGNGQIMYVMMVLVAIVIGLAVYFRYKHKSSKEYKALIDTNLEEINPFIIKGQYSSMGTQV